MGDPLRTAERVRTQTPVRDLREAAAQIVAEHAPLVVIAVLYVLYAGMFIYRTSFVVDGERYFSLFDDAMISMRYAENLARGYGLVWNAGGERIEGYTNPLWVLYMAVIHLLPIVKSKMSLLVQATGALLLLANVLVVYRITLAISERSRFAATAAAAITAFFLPLNTWGLQGMEVSLLVVIISSASWRAVRSLQRHAFPASLYPLLGVATLVRSDAAVLVLAFALFHLLADSNRRRLHLIFSVLTLLVFVGGQTLFRLLYIGDILPNTYYLKMTGYPLVLPLFFALFCASIAGLRTKLLLHLPGTARSVLFLRAGSVVLLASALVTFSTVNGLESMAEMLLAKRALHVSDNEQMVRLARALAGITTEDARIAVVLAGTLPYFAERYSIDMLGKNDRVIAQGPAHVRGTGFWRLVMFWPGHTKWNYAYSIGHLQPDVVVGLWEAPNEATEYLRSTYHARVLDGQPVYVKLESHAVSLDK